ncbi:hypothetical protein P4O66_017773 [Electrophorus voltai]|uniref:CD3e molecule, epsilon associated protein n=1 Tax=Electrophorus voltai TaxID=2609070 RepID=A0AAD8YRL3_9TELE|nr:hypothetical protein P4O66_017773 [Electrophorus voltai]
MSCDISSSDSEKDDHHEISQNSQEKHKRVSKYKCPADFVSLKYNSAASALLDKDEQNKELWLIKAPSRFDPKIFTDLKVSLSGLKTIQATGATPQLYSVLGSCAGPTDVHVLTSSCQNQGTLSTSSFKGILSISESYGDCMGSRRPLSIPTAPAPCVPLSDLRQRFQPFGSSMATRAAGATTSASSLSPVRVKLDSERCGEQRKKKKKKKKEKHGKEENVEVFDIKQEQISYDCDEMQVPESAEEDGTVATRKKRKKKKEKPTEDCPDEAECDASLIAKQEPVDTSYDEVDRSVKKKKKKKKKTLHE